MYSPQIPQDKPQIVNIIEQSIELFQRTGMQELASKWERILKTYNAQKDRLALYQKS